mgnify:CR=1 FL=1
MDNSNEILLKVICEGNQHSIITSKNAYRSLMVLIKDRFYPDGFGECGGMGRCATCLVRLSAIKEIPGMDRNESSTLSKQGIIDPFIRLSCQLLVDVSLHDRTIAVLDSV